VNKRYEAVVHGEVADTGDGWRVIELPIAVDWPNRPLRVINHAEGKPSITRLQRIGFDTQHNTSHVLLEPLTGRTHQLRLHLQAIGHPILGDALYAPPAVLSMAPRLMLHACVLGFAHPVSGASLEFRAAEPFPGREKPHKQEA
jgi:tRNA pseudouridine32 synthase/23S rRNA pseudouridine746 synthase